MISCPPYSYFEEQNYDDRLTQETPSVPPADLMTLLRLSADLPLNGEVTPIMAFYMIRNHERAGELTMADLEQIKGELTGKIRCHGWGFPFRERAISTGLADA
jgi:hypothetical protein